MSVELRSETDGRVLKRYEASEKELRALPLLLEAREAMQAQDPLKAFDLVCEAIRQTAGESAILPMIDRAKEWHQQQEEAWEEAARNAPKSILREQGRLDIIRDAIDDGSTAMCPKCSGYIAINRLQSHQSVWCPSLPQKERKGKGERGPL